MQERLRKPLIFFFLLLQMNNIHSKEAYECEYSSGRKISLTFDDGPRPNRTEHVLEALNTRQTPATFFQLGSQVELYPELAKEVALYHPIANHGWAHIDYSRSSAVEQEEDITLSTNILKQWLDVPWKFRLPYGSGYRGEPQQRVEQKGYQHVYWNIDPRDWDARLTAEQSYQRIEQALAHPPLNNKDFQGYVAVLHDVQAKTAAYIGEWIDRLVEKGHCIVPLREIAL